MNKTKKSKSKFRWKRENWGENGAPSYAMSVNLPTLNTYDAFIYMDNELDENPKAIWEWSVSSLVADYEYCFGEGTARTKEEAMLKCETRILKEIDKRIEQLTKWRKSK